jgi:hypothetical protein
MKKIMHFLWVIAILSLIFGCAGMATYNEVPGGLYADYKMGFDAEGTVGSKEGRACATSILGWVATGDASIKTAAANGGISKVYSIEHEVKNILNIHATYCTVVRGD